MKQVAKGGGVPDGALEGFRMVRNGGFQRVLESYGKAVGFRGAVAG